MMAIKKEEIINWLSHTTELLIANKDYLTELDAAIGDADHGLNISRGFIKVREKINTLSEGEDLSSIFKNVAMVLISSVGGASGSLYGSFFLKGFMPLSKKHEITDEDLLKMFDAGIKGIQDRGRAIAGDKTMIDVWLPVLEEMKFKVAEGKHFREFSGYLAEVALKATQATAPMIAKKGRASYLGERSVGHIDPGAASTYLIIKSLAEVVK